MSKLRAALAVLTSHVLSNAGKANTNAKDKPTKTLKKVVANKDKPSKNERGDDDDARQIRADLIASENTPFVPDDEEALRWMSQDTLLAMRDSYLPKAEENADDEEEPTEENSEDETEENADEESTEENAEDEEEKPAANTKKVEKKGKPMSTKKNCGQSALSDDDKAALAYAKQIVANKRKELVDAVVANSGLTEEQAGKLDNETLEALAANASAAVSYAGRAVPKSNNENAPESVKAMTAISFADAVRNANKKEAA